MVDRSEILDRIVTETFETAICRIEDVSMLDEVTPGEVHERWTQMITQKRGNGEKPEVGHEERLFAFRAPHLQGISFVWMDLGQPIDPETRTKSVWKAVRGTRTWADYR